MDSTLVFSTLFKNPCLLRAGYDYLVKILAVSSTNLKKDQIEEIADQIEDIYSYSGM